MGFGSKSSSTPPPKQPEPTYTDQDVDATNQDRRATAMRRVERYETRDTPSGSMIGEPTSTDGNDPTATPRHRGASNGRHPRRHAAQIG